ncbi:MAG: NAD(+)/NADH kinase [Eubacterium sp.]
MKNFCIVTNSYKDEKEKLAKKIAEYIRQAGGVCTIKNNVDGNTGEYKVIKAEKLSDNLECIITIGGDGTLLHAAKDLLELDVVFVGVNKGTLGFLAEISPEELETALDKLLQDEFNVESRMMLKGQVIRNGNVVYRATVLNDIVIHRGGDIAMSAYNVYVNGQLLSTYAADGIILSTPTGSTAYNLSAGGPVARPDSHMIIVTPICPHTISTRSILLSRNDEIEVEVGACKKPGEEHRKLAFDGDGIFNIVSGDRIRISEALETTEIAKLDEGSFLQVIKDKLGN